MKITLDIPVHIHALIEKIVGELGDRPDCYLQSGTDFTSMTTTWKNKKKEKAKTKTSKRTGGEITHLPHRGDAPTLDREDGTPKTVNNVGQVNATTKKGKKKSPSTRRRNHRRLMEYNRRKRAATIPSPSETAARGSESMPPAKGDTTPVHTDMEITSPITSQRTTAAPQGPSPTARQTPRLKINIIDKPKKKGILRSFFGGGGSTTPSNYTSLRTTPGTILSVLPQQPPISPIKEIPGNTRRKAAAAEESIYNKTTIIDNDSTTSENTDTSILNKTTRIDSDSDTETNSDHHSTYDYTIQEEEYFAKTTFEHYKLHIYGYKDSDTYAGINGEQTQKIPSAMAECMKWQYGDEIIQEIQNDNISQEDRNILQYLRKNYDNIITKEDDETENTDTDTDIESQAA